MFKTCIEISKNLCEDNCVPFSILVNRLCTELIVCCLINITVIYFPINEPCYWSVVTSTHARNNTNYVC